MNQALGLLLGNDQAPQVSIRQVDLAWILELHGCDVLKEFEQFRNLRPDERKVGEMRDAGFGGECLQRYNAQLSVRFEEFGDDLRPAACGVSKDDFILHLSEVQSL